MMEYFRHDISDDAIRSIAPNISWRQIYLCHGDENVRPESDAFSLMKTMERRNNFFRGERFLDPYKM